jgi:hypothetical protein
MKAGVGLLGLALAGCASTPRGTTERFLCDRGTTLAVVFMDDHAMLRAGGEAPVRLDQQLTGSGYSYTSATRSIRGKGRALTYTMGRMAPEECITVEE